MNIGKLPLNPDVSDTAPTGQQLTPYDIDHVVIYARILDADARGSPLARGVIDRASHRAGASESSACEPFGPCSG